MAFKKHEVDEDTQSIELVPESTGRQRKASIPFTYEEAEVYADMISRLTGQVVGAQQDDHGQWGVALETTIVRVKRLTTLSAVTKYLGRMREGEPEEADEELS